MVNSDNTIRSFRDLKVYQNLYDAMKLVKTKLIPKLPPEEKYNLSDQLNRACQAAPALIAEGFPKRFLKRQWSRYLTDAIGECNEMIHHVSVCADLYSKFVDNKLCNKLIETYDISARQLTSLGKKWKEYHQRREHKTQNSITKRQNYKTTKT